MTTFPKSHKNYADALFSAKRGFVVIGLTGYTGSGCSTTARILKRDTKFELPTSYTDQPAESTDLATRQYSALHRLWSRTPWESHTIIEVGAIIIAILFCQSINEETPADFPEIIKTKANENRAALTALNFLRSTDSLSIDSSLKLVDAYETCTKLLREIRSTESIANFISTMQLSGDKIRLYGGFRDGPPHPDNMFVLPEAIRRVIRCYRKGHGKTRFVIDAFRNPFEIEYFKRRYAEFYLVCLHRAPKRSGDLLTQSDDRN